MMTTQQDHDHDVAAGVCMTILALVALLILLALVR